MTGTASRGRPARIGRWLGIAAATGVAATAWTGYWWLAVPRYDVCPAVLPAPAGCRSADRVSTATGWTAVVAALLLATVVLAAVRPRGRWWPFGLGMVALGLVALWGLWAVRYTF
ncbi:hypothetical protein [Micromonospora sp. C95]|uniref:hypothetical protein n=1 Tax=Micromonospora sp. C95 TaxID=2824882 RepID=UPI001B38CB14|nr:hypothetical protein [Micromonospora sp. C95]MBQ1028211.1 hypothetical protein [Micromonospora sp. C95]